MTSGIRIGTPAATTRGMKEQEIAKIADFMDRALSSCEDENKLSTIREEVKEMLRAFPLYDDWAREMEKM